LSVAFHKAHATFSPKSGLYDFGTSTTARPVLFQLVRTAKVKVKVTVPTSITFVKDLATATAVLAAGSLGGPGRTSVLLAAVGF